ncbi:Fur family transcriptional regulator [Paradesertivirga mongoliensis]|uniref:Fur family transcriptional regulator n=1 Tax=Paradesertivirga mongoliensis TaxID=2100740 RepID=A0ABW4ZM81_9SPHI|nr:transcriptional repressor [Pedobacter mongoliensis]
MKSIRNTVAKNEIHKLIAGSTVALSQAELQAATKGLCDRVTIYRILDRLTQEGLIHKVLNVDGVMKYAGCADTCKAQHKHDHIHFSCQKCKSLTCLAGVEASYRLPAAYTVMEANFTLSGICPNCT